MKKMADSSLDSLVSNLPEKQFNLVWKASFDYSEIPHGILVDDKYAFVSFAKNGTRAIASLDLKDGSTRWEQAERGSVLYPFFLTDDSLFILKKSNGDEPNILSLEKKKGRRVGSLGKSDLKGFGPIERIVGTYDAYTLAGFSNKLVSLDWRLGVVWDLPIPCEKPEMVFCDGSDAVIKTSSGLYRINTGKGKAVWQLEMGKLDDVCYVLDNVAYVKKLDNGDSEICAVNLGNGDIKWSVHDDSYKVARFISGTRSLKYMGYSKSADKKLIETCNSLSLKTGRRLGASKGAKLGCIDLSVHKFEGKELVLKCANPSNYEMTAFRVGEEQPLWKRKVHDKFFSMHNGNIFINDDDKLLVLSSECGKEIGRLDLGDDIEDPYFYGFNGDSFLVYCRGNCIIQRYDLI